MRPFLISALLLSLVTGCSSVNLGPHRIDVQQGNALDQENVSRLKTGLNRSQVRFLLGTPLVVDPFRTDRWDYVYVNYKAGKLAEQKRITLFFDGETLVRIEGDVPAAETVAPPAALPAATESKAVPTVEPSATSGVEARPLPRQAAPQAEPIPLAQASGQTAAQPVPATGATPAPATAPQQMQPAAQSPAPEGVTRPVAQQAADPAPVSEVETPQPVSPAPSRAAPETSAAVADSRPTGTDTSVVKPLPSPSNAPPYRDPRTPAEFSLVAETNIEQVRPDVMPPFPEPGQAVTPPVHASSNDEAVLAALRNWVKAWSTRDEDAYLAAYGDDFVPEGAGTRAEWEKRRRLLLGVAKNIELNIDSPSIDYLADGSATVTFNQHYRSDNFRDGVVKQVRMVKRGDHWLIVEEKILSVLRGGKR